MTRKESETFDVGSDLDSSVVDKSQAKKADSVMNIAESPGGLKSVKED